MITVKNMVTKEYAPYCVICRTHNHKAGYGISFNNGAHICMECALDVYDILDDCFREQVSQMDEEDAGEDTAHGGGD